MQFLRTLWRQASRNFYNRNAVDKANISMSLPNYVCFAMVSRAIYLDHKAGSQISSMSTLEELKEWSKTSKAMLRPTDQVAIEDLVVRLERRRVENLLKTSKRSDVVYKLPEVAGMWKNEKGK